MGVFCSEVGASDIGEVGEETMSSVIMRNCFEPGGFAYILNGGKCKPLPKNVAYLVSDYGHQRREVTWDDVMDKRRERQSRIMEHIRSEPEPAIVPCYVWAILQSAIHSLPRLLTAT